MGDGFSRGPLPWVGSARQRDPDQQRLRDITAAVVRNDRGEADDKKTLAEIRRILLK